MFPHLLLPPDAAKRTSTKRTAQFPACESLVWELLVEHQRLQCATSPVSQPHSSTVRQPRNIGQVWLCYERYTLPFHPGRSGSQQHRVAHFTLQKRLYWKLRRCKNISNNLANIRATYEFMTLEWRKWWKTKNRRPDHVEGQTRPTFIARILTQPIEEQTSNTDKQKLILNYLIFHR